jgi:hypothetical protein
VQGQAEQDVPATHGIADKLLDDPTAVADELDGSVTQSNKAAPSTLPYHSADREVR